MLVCKVIRGIISERIMYPNIGKLILEFMYSDCIQDELMKYL